MEKINKEYSMNVYNEHTKEFEEKTEEFMLRYIIEKDDAELMEEYSRAVEISIRSGHDSIDDLITPNSKLVYKWYMEKYRKTDNVRTIRYMTHAVEANLLKKEQKREYLNYKCYNEEI